MDGVAVLQGMESGCIGNQTSCSASSKEENEGGTCETENGLSHLLSLVNFVFFFKSHYPGRSGKLILKSLEF